MTLLQRILECNSDEEVDTIIKERIAVANVSSKKVDQLGFVEGNNAVNVYKGFIPLDTRIKYENFAVEDYSMNTTDFLYEFARFVRRHNIEKKSALVCCLEHFINSYFDYPGKASRKKIFNDIAWHSTKTDEEYFEALQNNKLGDLKGKGAASCTERGALAQQVLSIFGIESFYCIGCIEHNGKQEAHCFNIVKRENDYAIVDYSVPVPAYRLDGSIKTHYPFIGAISNEEFLDFLNNGYVKSFEDYCVNDNKKQMLGNTRRYVIGKYKIPKEEIDERAREK